MKEADATPWLLTIVYASLRAVEREKAWLQLLSIAHHIQVDWLVVGDFNEISNLSEKKGGAPMDINRCIEFSN